MFKRKPVKTQTGTGLTPQPATSAAGQSPQQIVTPQQPPNIYSQQQTQPNRASPPASQQQHQQHSQVYPPQSQHNQPPTQLSRQGSRQPPPVPQQQQQPPSSQQQQQPPQLPQQPPQRHPSPMPPTNNADMDAVWNEQTEEEPKEFLFPPPPPIPATLSPDMDYFSYCNIYPVLIQSGLYNQQGVVTEQLLSNALLDDLPGARIEPELYYNSEFELKNTGVVHEEGTHICDESVICTRPDCPVDVDKVFAAPSLAYPDALVFSSDDKCHFFQLNVNKG